MFVWNMSAMPAWALPGVDRVGKHMTTRENLFCCRASKDRCYRRARGKLRSVSSRAVSDSFGASGRGARSTATSDLLRSADVTLRRLKCFRTAPDGTTNCAGTCIGARPRNSSARSKTMPTRKTRTQATTVPTSDAAPLEVPEQVSGCHHRERQASAIARSPAAVDCVPWLPMVKGVHCLSH